MSDLLCILAASVAFNLPAFEIERHTNVVHRGGVTLAQKGGLSDADYVVRDIEPYAFSNGVSSVNGETGAVVITVSKIGAVPTTRTINGKGLGANIALTPGDIGAMAAGSVVGSARTLPKYLHALDFSDSYPGEAREYYLSRGDGKTDGGCSAVRDGGFVYRNFDYPFDERAEFVVRMSAGNGRFASVGVAQVGTNLTEEIVTGGKWSKWYKALPGATVDGINENGVVCEINVVGGDPHENGWPSEGTVHCLGAVRHVLDGATTAGSAASNLVDCLFFPAGFSQNFHWMIADATETWIVENGVASNVTAVAAKRVMTNFPILPDTYSGEGAERYRLLRDGNDITNAWWTLAYLPETRPIRYSDLGTNYESIWERWAYESREAHRGESSGGQTWWQTVHTSVYDVTNLTLRVSVQESGDWYSFAVPVSGSGRALDGKRDVDDRTWRERRFTEWVQHSSPSGLYPLTLVWSDALGGWVSGEGSVASTDRFATNVVYEALDGEYTVYAWRTELPPDRFALESDVSAKRDAGDMEITEPTNDHWTWTAGDGCPPEFLSRMNSPGAAKPRYVDGVWTFYDQVYGQGVDYSYPDPDEVSVSFTFHIGGFDATATRPSATDVTPVTVGRIAASYDLSAKRDLTNRRWGERTFSDEWDIQLTEGDPQRIWLDGANVQVYEEFPGSGRYDALLGDFKIDGEYADPVNIYDVGEFPISLVFAIDDGVVRGKATATRTETTDQFALDSETDAKLYGEKVRLGESSSADGDYSVGVGYTARALSAQGVSVGPWAVSSGYRAVAVGAFSRATNGYAVAIGDNARSHGPNTFNVPFGIGSWYAGDMPLVEAILSVGWSVSEVEEVVTNDPPAMASGRFSAGPGVVVTNRYTVYVPDPDAPKVVREGCETSRDLAAMLVDANTNETADCECIRTNMCNLVHDGIVDTVNTTKSRFYDSGLGVEWTFVPMNGEFMFIATTNVNREVIE